MNDSPEPASSVRPTRVRYAVLAVCCLSAILLYLDRFCMNFAQRYVREDLGISNDALGWSMFSFFITYALFQIPAGWLTDRFGPRKLMTVYILAWSLMTGLMGAVGSFAGLIAVRLAAGVAQAGAYPTCAAVVRKWMPLRNRGMGNSIIAFGGRVGGGIAPLLTALLVITFVPSDVSPLLTEADLLPIETEGVASPSVAPKPSAEQRRADVAQQLLARTEIDSISQAEPSQAVAALNELITGPVLADKQDLEEISLEKEADRLLEQQTLLDTQRQRLNRLILEAVFKEHIRKLYVQGWRPVMILYGLLGLPIALLFWLIVRDGPERHSQVNEAEQELITHFNTPAGKKPPFPWKEIVTSRSLWLLSFSQFGTNIGWAFLVTWLPRYLDEVHQVPFAQRGLMVAIPIFCGWPGVIFGGWLTDRMATRFGLRWGRALPIGLTRFVAAFCYLAMLLEPSPWIAIAFFSLVAFSTDSGTGAVWSVNQDVGGEYTASVLGWGNMWGNIGAAVSPVLLQKVMKSTTWNGAFVVAALAFLLAGLCGLYVDSRQQVMAETDSGELS
ncbi:MAG: MFS transporter [Planctomycetaceae bacterium]|nr:MFS transporter [Planctomycetaceae bacterium]